ncbi:ABC transporter substrate-binding protein [Paenibacillus alvei]|uniref:ABC transporter substrate-binding protein n=1 Tax=Paenibacillus alvei TaxID=44250 RepID=A0AAP7DJP9_PAEAL|nr:ABC transporter substrate-binding protein [Paenibacillus alvei]NOJ71859.1 ABC transporter substrate-binding protein [Paenibacillus alvei]
MAKMKRTTMLLLACFMVFTLFLSACSGKGSSEGGSSSESDGKPTEITFWYGVKGKDGEYLDKMVEKFNAGQKEVVVKALGGQDHLKQLTAISGGNPPDILQTQWNFIGPWSEAGAIMSLDEFIQKDKFDMSRLIPAAFERMKVDGKAYGMPIRLAMANKLFYNKKMFEDAGITAPPETLEDMFELAKKLTKKDSSGSYTQIGFIPDYPWIDSVFWPTIFGGSWDDGNGKLTANQKANVDAIDYQMSYYREFGNAGIDKIKSGMGGLLTPQDPIVTGKLGMIIGWDNWYVTERSEGKIGVAPFPYPKDKPELKNAGMVSPVAMYIPTKAKNKDAAWKFLQFMLSDEAQIEMTLVNGSIPSVLSVLDNEKIKNDPKLAVNQEFFESAKSENLKGFPNTIYIDAYLQSLTEETEKALKGQQTAQEAMDNVVKKIQPLADKAQKK